MTDRASGPAAPASSEGPAPAGPGDEDRLTAGEAVAVAIRAADPITGAGTAAYLRTRPGITPLPAESAHRADVILVLVNLVSEDILAWMQQVAARAAGESKFVLIGDGVRAPQLRRATSFGLVSVIPRQGCDYDQIVRAIEQLHQGRVELPGAELRSLLTRSRPRQIRSALLAPSGSDIQTGLGVQAGAAAGLAPQAGLPQPAGAPHVPAVLAAATAMEAAAASGTEARPGPGTGTALGEGNETAPGSVTGGLPGTEAPAGVPLETRERDVLRLLAEGLGTAEIGHRLNYSERTVKNIIHHLLTRMNLRNRPHAVAFALRNGLL